MRAQMAALPSSAMRHQSGLPQTGQGRSFLTRCICSSAIAHTPHETKLDLSAEESIDPVSDKSALGARVVTNGQAEYQRGENVVDSS